MIDAGVLARLAASKDADGTPYLALHHLAAGDRLERLVERARLAPRVTMSYDAGAAGGRRQAVNTAQDMSDTVAQARGQLNVLAAQLPPDCWGVVLDVCVFGKGLQDIEIERRWPRRSAKLVLRIGLDQLASQFGLAPHRAGGQGKTIRGWLDDRLPLIPVATP